MEKHEKTIETYIFVKKVIILITILLFMFIPYINYRSNSEKINNLSNINKKENAIFTLNKK